MKFSNIEIRKVIKQISTRWLSLGKCIEITLNEWELLKLYFLSQFDLQGDPTVINLAEKKRLIEAFKDPVTKLYVMFVQSVIPILTVF